jgi:hypothetical protein
MFPFGMSLSDRIDFLNTGKTIYTSVGNNNYGGCSFNKPTAAGLSYSQGYMDGSSISSGRDSLKSGQFGATIGHMGFAGMNGTMNSYNQGFLNGTRNR